MNSSNDTRKKRIRRREDDDEDIPEPPINRVRSDWDKIRLTCALVIVRKQVLFLEQKRGGSK